MINIQIPPTHTQERRYILSVIFGEFLGIEYQIQLDNRSDVRITKGDAKELLINDGFFSVPEDEWLQQSSLPIQPLKVWDLSSTPLNANTICKQIPVIYGNDSHTPDFFQLSENQIRLELDIFGSSFFMLTRYEEMIKPDRDKHGRFPAVSSLAYQEGFLGRPIINEYLEILWDCLNRLWPNLERKKKEFKIVPSHDVDKSYEYAFKSPKWILRVVAEDVIKRQNIKLAIDRVKV